MSQSDPIPAATRTRLRRRLLAWYDANRRDLPWRRTHDPYAIWISETMLQQTRVDTVIAYYERFLERFPDVETLAKADLEDVYGAWTGLGYYSRARHLHGAAATVVAEHGGRLPDTADDLRGLAGVGRYTAGAIASIGFDREEPVVDGNVIRVLARLLGIRDDVTRADVRERFWSCAGQLVAGQRPGDFNQALMELGATLCTPRVPHCSACPFARDCDARATGDAEALPVKPRKPAPRPIRGVAAWLARKGRVLVVRRAEGGLLGGMWELPGGEILADESPRDALRRCLEEGVGLAIGRTAKAGEVEHVFTHRRLRLHVFRCDEPTGRVRRRGWADHRWVSSDALAHLPHGGPTRKALALLDGGTHATPHRARVRGAGPGTAT